MCMYVYLHTLGIKPRAIYRLGKSSTAYLVYLHHQLQSCISNEREEITKGIIFNIPFQKMKETYAINKFYIVYVISMSYSIILTYVLPLFLLLHHGPQ